MKNLNISQASFSKLFWTIILNHSEFEFLSRKEEFFRQTNALEKLRATAEYNTGSISPFSAWLLFSLTYYFQPKVICEVGTFIGKSTIAIGMAAPEGAVIHTCDFSNDIKLPKVSGVEIYQYPMTSSAVMLSKLVLNHVIPDFYHFDGRISNDDLEALLKLNVSNAVIAVDDYEGLEKGLANHVALSKLHVEKSHYLVYPPDSDIAGRCGFNSSSTTMILVPKNLIQFTKQ